MRFSKAALAVALIGFLTFGVMPNQGADCPPALIAAPVGWEKPSYVLPSVIVSDPDAYREYEEARDAYRCGAEARDFLIRNVLIGTGFLAAVAAAEYVLKTGKEKEALGDE
jgi:hypothetical protein